MERWMGQDELALWKGRWGGGCLADVQLCYKLEMFCVNIPLLLVPLLLLLLLLVWALVQVLVPSWVTGLFYQHSSVGVSFAWPFPPVWIKVRYFLLSSLNSHIYLFTVNEICILSNWCVILVNPRTRPGGGGGGTLDFKWRWGANGDIN